MKKEYMKPAMCVVELQHKTQLLQEEIGVSDQGGGSNILDR